MSVNVFFSSKQTYFTLKIKLKGLKSSFSLLITPEHETALQLRVYVFEGSEQSLCEIHMLCFWYFCSELTICHRPWPGADFQHKVCTQPAVTIPLQCPLHCSTARVTHSASKRVKYNFGSPMLKASVMTTERFIFKFPEERRIKHLVVYSILSYHSNFCNFYAALLKGTQPLLHMATFSITVF